MAEVNDKRRGRRVQGGWNSVPGCTGNLKSASGGVKRKQPSDVGNYAFQVSSEIKRPTKKPANFSWVIEGLLAGTSIPREVAHLQYLMDQGVKHLVTLTGDRPPVQHCPGLNHVHSFIPEFDAPSMKQVEDFVALVETAKANNESVAVHCRWGIGRTGTMLACYLVKSDSLSAKEAIRQIRQLRPYSIETYEQEEVVHLYYDSLYGASACSRD